MIIVIFILQSIIKQRIGFNNYYNDAISDSISDIPYSRKYWRELNLADCQFQDKIKNWRIKIWLIESPRSAKQINFYNAHPAQTCMRIITTVNGVCHNSLACWTSFSDGDDTFLG